MTSQKTVAKETIVGSGRPGEKHKPAILAYPLLKEINGP